MSLFVRACVHSFVRRSYEYVLEKLPMKERYTRAATILHTQAARAYWQLVDFSPKEAARGASKHAQIALQASIPSIMPVQVGFFFIDNSCLNERVDSDYYVWNGRVTTNCYILNGRVDSDNYFVDGRMDGDDFFVDGCVRGHCYFLSRCIVG